MRGKKNNEKIKILFSFKNFIKKIKDFFFFYIPKNKNNLIF
jgi:hypothetical protein